MGRINIKEAWKTAEHLMTYVENAKHDGRALCHPRREEVEAIAELINDMDEKIHHLEAYNIVEAAKEAIKISKELQEDAIAPVLRIDEMLCGQCGERVTRQYMAGGILFDEQFKYCPMCGRMVKWEAENNG